MVTFMEAKSFTNKEAAEALGMKQATIAFYTNKGFVTPEIANPKGRGTTRRYSKYNLFEFLLIKELARHGLNLERIKTVLFTQNIEWKVNERLERGDILRIILVIYNDADAITIKFLYYPDLKDKMKFEPLIDMENHCSAIAIDITQLLKRVRNL